MATKRTCSPIPPSSATTVTSQLSVDATPCAHRAHVHSKQTMCAGHSSSPRCSQRARTPRTTTARRSRTCCARSPLARRLRTFATGASPVHVSGTDPQTAHASRRIASRAEHCSQDPQTMRCMSCASSSIPPRSTASTHTSRSTSPNTARADYTCATTSAFPPMVMARNTSSPVRWRRGQGCSPDRPHSPLR